MDLFKDNIDIGAAAWYRTRTCRDRHLHHEGDTMAAISPVEPEPYDPVDPTNCPTCRSGLQPLDPPYEDAIDPNY